MLRDSPKMPQRTVWGKDIVKTLGIYELNARDSGESDFEKVVYLKSIFIKGKN